jgi:hypothetical protein
LDRGAGAADYFLVLSGGGRRGRAMGSASPTAGLQQHGQPSIVTKCPKPATEMMRANAGFHADQARRHVCKSCFHLATRPLLTQHDRAALIKANVRR